MTTTSPMLVQSLLHLVQMLMRDACKKETDDSEDELDPKDNKTLAEMDIKRNLRPWLIVRFATFITITNFTLFTVLVIRYVYL